MDKLSLGLIVHDGELKLPTNENKSRYCLDVYNVWYKDGYYIVSVEGYDSIKLSGNDLYKYIVRQV